MRDGKSWRRLCLSLLAAGLSGCSHSTVTVTSYAAKDMHAEIKRLMVVVSVAQYKTAVAPSGIRISAFKTAFTEALGKCPITTSFLFTDELSAIDGRVEAVRTFSPDALLSLDGKYSQSGESDKRELYLTGIIDMVTKKMAWKAVVDVPSGPSRDEVLAVAIVDRVKSDGVLGPCN